MKVGLYMIDLHLHTRHSDGADLVETLLLNADGLAFLAHAYIYPFNNVEEEVENILSKKEIDGIECEHSLLSEEQRMNLKELCRKYGKHMSGGSDYHGEIIPDIRIKTGINDNLNISKDFIDDWYNKIRFKIK